MVLNDSTLVLRLKVLVAEYGRTAFRLLVVLAVVSALAAGWIATSPERSSAVRETDVQSVSAGVSHSAVVTGDDAVWEQGTVLRNRSTYLRDASPTLRLQANASVPSSTDVAVRQRLVLVVTASHEGSPFYTERTTLAADNGTVTDGTATVTATVNASAVRAWLAALREEFGPVAELTATVRHVVVYDTGTYAGRLTASAPLVVEQQAYWLEGGLSSSRRHATRVRSVTTERRSGAALSLVILAIVAAGAAATVRVYTSRDLDREQLLHDLHAAQLSEWISEGELPVDVGDQHVRLKALVDVVDIGIDNDKRVIHDPRRELYAVVDGTVVYYYCEDATWWETAWRRPTGRPVRSPPGGGPGGDSGPGSGVSGGESGPGSDVPGGEFGMGEFDPGGDDPTEDVRNDGDDDSTEDVRNDGGDDSTGDVRNDGGDDATDRWFQDDADDQ